MINFACPRCSTGIVAEPEMAGASAECPSCGTGLLVPRPPEPRVTPPSKKLSGRRFLYGGFAVLALVFVVGGITAWLNRRPATIRESALAAKAGNTGGLGGKFWEFQFGETYQNTLAIVKRLKMEGDLADLSTGRVMAGWMPGSDSVSARLQTNMAGILSRPAEDIDLLFKGDRLVGIELRYGFKKRNASTLLEIQAKDMERYLSSFAKIETHEDDVGNRTRTATIEGNGIVAKIRDRLDGDFASFAPGIRIVGQDER